MFTAQSLLFVPGHRADRFGKARTAGVTMVAARPVKVSQVIRFRWQRLEALIIRRYQAILDAKDRMQHA